MPDQVNDHTSGRRHVFISYARDDDEAFARQLWLYLTQHAIAVWWDREAMQSRGLSFLQEIRDAISSAERVLLIVGPQAKLKPYVEVEWRHALREGVVVTPLLRLGDYDDVPEALRALHCEDVRATVDGAHALERVLQIVGAPVAPLGELVGVPRLPTPYLERATQLDQLRSRVLIDAYKPVDLEPDQRITSITGMGGAGKTVLAVGLAHAPEVRRSFTDGVRWINVGRDVNAVRTATHVGLALGDEAIQAYTGIVEAKFLLEKKLADMNCLVVLDDVTDVGIIETLHTAASENVRILLTSRRRNLFASAGVHEVHVDELEEGDALNLLAHWAGVIREQLPPEGVEIARACGNLPLALSMIGSIIRGRGDRWAYALARLQHADLSKIEQKLPDYEFTTLDRAMLVSFEELDAGLQQRYLDFVAVPEDVAAPAGMLRTWWTYEGMDELDVTAALDELVDRSLLRVDQQGGYTLHDIQRDFLLMRTMDTHALHVRWVTAFQAHAPGGWATAEDDGYIFDHLGYHLSHAGAEAEWRELLTSFAWLERKSRARGFAAVLLDLVTYAGDVRVSPLHRTCRRAAHILTNDPAQLAAQLLARTDPVPDVAPLLNGARAWRGQSWLRPVTNSLDEAGEPTVAVFRGREEDGHAGTPRAIALSRDAGLIGSAGGSSNDLSVKIWSAQATRLLRTFDNALSPGSITRLAFVTQDGSLAVAGQHDVCLYRPDATEPLARHEFGDYVITSLCGGGPPGTAFVGFEDGAVVAWDSNSDSLAPIRDPDGQMVVAMACASLLPRIAIAADLLLECRDSHDGHLVGRVDEQLGSGAVPFQAPPLIMAANGSRVLFGNPPRSWTITGDLVESLMKFGDAPPVVGLSEDGAVAVVAPADSELAAIDTASGQQISSIRNTREFSCAAVTPDGSAAVTADFEHDIKIWDLSRSHPEQPAWQLRGVVGSVAICDEPEIAVVGDQIWNTSIGRPRAAQEQVAQPRLARRGDRVPERPIVSELQAKLAELVDPVEEVNRALRPFGVLAISPAADRAVSASLNLAKGMDAEEEPYRGGERGAPLAVWSTRDLRQIRQLWGHMSSITCADITSDGTRALTGSRGRLLRLWNLDTGACLQVLRGHRGIVYDCALTDDARLAVSGSEDMTVRLWDLVQGRLLFTFAASSAVRACDISRNGSVAIGGEISGRVHTFAVVELPGSLPGRIAPSMVR